MTVNVKLTLDKNYSRWTAACQVPNELTGLVHDDPSFVKEVTFVGGALDHVMTLAKEYFEDIEKKLPGEKVNLSFFFEGKDNHPHASKPEPKPAEDVNGGGEVTKENTPMTDGLSGIITEQEKLVEDPYRKEVFLDTACTCNECGTMITSPRIVVRPFIKEQNFYIGLAAYCPLCGREIKHNGIEAYNRKARKFAMNETAQSAFND